jgi:hypothetical protein
MMTTEQEPVKKPENEADREVLTKLLVALAKTSELSDCACCDGARPPQGLWDAAWAWHSPDCPFKHGADALVRLLGLPALPLVEEDKKLFESIKATDGAEIHQHDWLKAERLVRLGLITLGPARGPNNMWRRAEVV